MCQRASCRGVYRYAINERERASNLRYEQSASTTPGRLDWLACFRRENDDASMHATKKKIRAKNCYEYACSKHTEPRACHTHHDSLTCNTVDYSQLHRSAAPSLMVCGIRQPALRGTAVSRCVCLCHFRNNFGRSSKGRKEARKQKNTKTQTTHI